MRVVAGSARGRRLAAPAGQATRPTGDRVREAVFNALGSLGALDGAVVADLFAGSGALGIEALSRGAAHVTFVEHDRAALAVVRANLDTTGFTGRSAVVAGDAEAFVATLPAGTHFDLALADPPYAFDRWDRLLAGLPATVVVAESDRPITPAPGSEVVREKRYGTTVVTIFRRLSTPPQE